ncbi:DUF6349 family protein (plasmid) [Streptomyces sp. NBC_01186]|uniref:DUF6349 family protein n=1 Tax=Streptomyces sp. NBC_01186 TaxID=2903765 RepID=UPI002E1316C6|nr:DUF6349 family protein [Streptomyces sp. NBC_01186]
MADDNSLLNWHRISARTRRELREAFEDMCREVEPGARARQSFHWRVRMARTRRLQLRDAYRFWHIRPGHPGGAWADTGHELDPPEDHTPTLLTRRTSDDAEEYRGACLACTWEGEERTGRTADRAAVEDAHDHAFPGWRTLLPLLGPARQDNTRAWALARALYPPHWLDAGAPQLVRRATPSPRYDPPSTREPRYRLHMPPPARTRTPVPEPPALF